VESRKLPSGKSLRPGGLLRRYPTLWPFLAMVALLALNAFLTPGFLHIEMRPGAAAWDFRLFGPLVDVLRNGAPVMMLAIGMTLVIALAGIDLSVGSVMVLAGTAAALLMTAHGQSVPLAIAAALGASLLVGLFNGALVTYVGLQPIIATLVFLVAGRGIAQTLTGDQNIRFDIPAFSLLGSGSFLGLPVPVYIVAATAALVALALHKTALGLYIEAIGSNARAARLAGLQVHAIRMLCYGFSGVCAGAAGIIVTADISQADVASCGLYLELDAILAVVIGGTSFSGGRPRLLGSLFGVIIMQTLTNVLVMHDVRSEHTLIVKAVVAMAVCLLQTPAAAGLIGRLSRAKARPA